MLWSLKDCILLFPRVYYLMNLGTIHTVIILKYAALFIVVGILPGSKWPEAEFP